MQVLLVDECWCHGWIDGGCGVERGARGGQPSLHALAHGVSAQHGGNHSTRQTVAGTCECDVVCGVWCVVYVPVTLTMASHGRAG